MRDGCLNRGKNSLDDLYRRPGFLLRRAHQICVALFLEETAGFGLTNTQYDIMLALRARGPLDQASIARWSGIDRSTSGLVVGTLEKLGYIDCRVDPVDKRRKIVSLSRAGRLTLAEMAGAAEHAGQRALQALPPENAAEFVQLLQRLIHALSDDIGASHDLDEHYRQSSE